MKLKKLNYAALVLTLFLVMTVKPAAANSSAKPSSDSAQNDMDASRAYILGKELVLKGEFEQAVAYFEQAHRADPTNPIVNAQLAEVHLRLRNIEKAEEYAKRAVEGEPNNSDFRNTLAGIYAGLKKYDEAKEQYLKVQELDPGNGKAPLLIGILEAERGRLSEGIDVLSGLIQQNPENTMALFYRARMYIEQDNVEKAKADLDKALALRPSFSEAGEALGLIHEKNNNSEEAIKAYSRIQGSGSFKKRLAQLYLQKGESEKALQELLEYEKSEPDDYTARVKIGLIYFEKKDLKAAEKVFEKVLKEEPSSDSVRFYYAWVLEESSKLKEALKEFKKVQSDSALYKEACLHVGFILKQQKKFDEGLKFSSQMLDKEPSVEEFYDMKAGFFEAKKEYKQSLAVLDSGLAKFPKSEKLLYFKGMILGEMGDKKGAVKTVKEIFQLNPSNYHALNFVGYTYAELGENLVEAEELVRKAMSLKPNDGFIEDSLGWILFKQGKYKESEEALERAAALQPQEAVIFEHLGELYEKQNNFAKAREFYKKVVELASSKDKEMLKRAQSKIASFPRDNAKPSSEKRLPTAQ